VLVRKPRATATPITKAMLSRDWIMLPSTWPVSTEVRAIAMVRNRAMIPLLISMATAVAVEAAAVPRVSRTIPGVT